jgi:hypothetical protein
MDNNAIKVVTGVLIAGGIYLFLKGRAASKVPGAQPLPQPGHVLAGMPMESSTCAIPIATDYLKFGQAHIPAVSGIVKRPPRVMPIIPQTVKCKVLHPTVSPIGITNSYVQCQQPPPLFVSCWYSPASGNLPLTAPASNPVSLVPMCIPTGSRGCTYCHCASRNCGGGFGGCCGNYLGCNINDCLV